ncbi:unnamed protein product [Clonostachys rosea]|uniref:Xylanolytic transcriptional activator regulatory domain-containing protein n=1 Tax=Bionectria ochroleuca TaxID=29856 RepID=A0ABY6TX50_BIOOC|nr:unnamed protein product [Clonostachys rosea]
METHMSRFRIRPSRNKGVIIRAERPPSRTSPTTQLLVRTTIDERNASDTASAPVCPGRTPSEEHLPTSEVAELRERLALMERLVGDMGMLTASRVSQEKIVVETPPMHGPDLSTQVRLEPSPEALRTPSSSRLPMQTLSPVHTARRRDSHSAYHTREERELKRRRLIQEEQSVTHSRETDEPSQIQGPEPAHLEATYDTLIDAYFRDVHRAYPFLDKNALLSTMAIKGEKDILSSKGQDSETTILYLVMAIGSITLQRATQDPGTPSDSGTALFDVNYQALVSKSMMNESITNLQILLLLAIYSQSDPVGMNTWAIIDILGRQAVRLGLTRGDTAGKGCSAADVERNHRLFWSIYVMDRMVALTTGTPAAMINANMDIPLPRITVEEFDSPQRQEQAHVLQVSRHIIQLRTLEYKVLQEIHLRDQKSTSSLTREDRYTLVVGLRAEIENWYSNGCLLQSNELDDMTIHIRICWLAARYYNLLLLLYYPCHFNPGTMLLSNGELLSLARKHVQANFVRFQQRQLPLNRLTLCRIFPVCMVFLHCFLSRQSAAECACAREEISMCADILAAFPEHWTLAHRAAPIIRQLAALVSSTSTKMADEASLTEADQAWCLAIKLSLSELSEKVLGRGSIYRNMHCWQGSERAMPESEMLSEKPSLPCAHFTPEEGDGIEVQNGDFVIEGAQKTSSDSGMFAGPSVLDYL